MRILVVEDEARAANRLIRLISELQPDATIQGRTGSVAATRQWLSANAAPDLIFMDIRLEDGDSFEILAGQTVLSPIIFCTAYSDYALQAFAVNSIDYLLKPIVRGDLARALNKYARYRGYRMSSAAWPSFPLPDEGIRFAGTYRKQFLVAVAGKFSAVKVESLIAARSYLKGTQLIDAHGKTWVLDDSLSEAEAGLDPQKFVRVSRQCLVRLSAVQSLVRRDNGYALLLAGIDDYIKVSRARVKSIKELLQQ